MKATTVKKNKSVRKVQTITAEEHLRYTMYSIFIDFILWIK